MAKWLHRALETFRVPRCVSGGSRIGHVFQDADELAASSVLNAAIEAALDRADSLYPRRRNQRLPFLRVLLEGRWQAYDPRSIAVSGDSGASRFVVSSRPLPGASKLRRNDPALAEHTITVAEPKMSAVYRNVSYATVGGLAALLDVGTDVVVSGQRTKEILHRITVIERPLERFLFVPGRNNDPFAQIAETLWVMAGRDDVGWLGQYVPRAADYSDDGLTWRGAYGPRLRCWKGTVDQFERIRDLLADDPASRRAVMNIFDPAVDYAATRDVPCNNWLAWTVRDGRLHLAVAVRSNDAVWGFSGVNAFEWSVLQEMLARWLGVGVGRQTWLAASFHVYERHWPRAARIVAGFQGRSPYDHGIRPVPFETPLASLDRALAAWFEAEKTVRSNPDVPIRPGLFDGDPFLSACLSVIRVRWGAPGWDDARLLAELKAMPRCDVTAAAWLHLGRERPAILRGVEAGLVRFTIPSAQSADHEVRLKEAVKRMHARKDRAYGSAWKRRGLVISVLPNVARKVDRLEAYRERGTRPGDEALLDTAIDLYVYATKHRLLLEEQATPTGLLPAGAPVPYGDHDANFDQLVDDDRLDAPRSNLAAGIAEVVEIFERLWRQADQHGSIPDARRLSDEMRDAAWRLLAEVAAACPEAVEELVTAEAAYAAGRGDGLEASGPGSSS